MSRDTGSFIFFQTETKSSRRSRQRGAPFVYRNRENWGEIAREALPGKGFGGGAPNVCNSAKWRTSFGGREMSADEIEPCVAQKFQIRWLIVRKGNTRCVKAVKPIPIRASAGAWKEGSVESMGLKFSDCWARFRNVGFRLWLNPTYRRPQRNASSIPHKAISVHEQFVGNEIHTNTIETLS